RNIFQVSGFQPDRPRLEVLPAVAVDKCIPCDGEQGGPELACLARKRLPDCPPVEDFEPGKLRDVLCDRTIARDAHQVAEQGWVMPCKQEADRLVGCTNPRHTCFPLELYKWAELGG